LAGTSSSQRCAGSSLAATHQADQHLGNEGAADGSEALAAAMLGLGEQVEPQRGAVEEPTVLQGLCLRRVRRRGTQLVRCQYRQAEESGDGLPGGYAQPVAA